MKKLLITTNMIKIFIIYSRADKGFKDQLLKAMSPLKKLVHSFHDGDILAGELWDTEIKGAIQQADLVLALVSNDFLSSDYIRNVEMDIALKRHEQGKSEFIPIIIRNCSWELDETLPKFNVLPIDAKPVDNWEHKDDAYKNIVGEVHAKILSILEKRQIEEEERIASERRQLEKKEWERSVQIGTVAAYREYVQKFGPKPIYVKEVYTALGKIGADINDVLKLLEADSTYFNNEDENASRVEASAQVTNGKKRFIYYVLISLMSFLVGAFLGHRFDTKPSIKNKVDIEVDYDKNMWEKTLQEGNISAFKRYKDVFSNGKYIESCDYKIKELTKVVNEHANAINGILNLPGAVADHKADIKSSIDTIEKYEPKHADLPRFKRSVQ